LRLIWIRLRQAARPAASISASSTSMPTTIPTRVLEASSREASTVTSYSLRADQVLKARQLLLDWGAWNPMIRGG
jgi:hypothetical protein